MGEEPMTGRRDVLAVDPATMALLVEHARAHYPNEACALLGGTAGAPERLYLVPNAEASPSFYVVEPKAQLAVMRALDDDDLELVGVFHSHTFSEAYPSPTDVALAGYPEALYMILSLADPDAPYLRAFRIVDGHVDEVAVVVEHARVAPLAQRVSARGDFETVGLIAADGESVDAEPVGDS